MLPTMAGAAHRCVIPEFKFDIEHLTELMVKDRNENPSNYSIVLISQGAMFENGEMVFQDLSTDAYGHAKLGGIGDLVSSRVRELSPKYNKGKKIEVISQQLRLHGAQAATRTRLIPLSQWRSATSRST